MSRTWFVTGTDTEVGKTAVCCALLTALGASGWRTAAIKPVAAGCDAGGHNEDALRLMACANQKLEYAQVNPVALREAIAPHIAAQREGRQLRAARLAGLCRGVMGGPADAVLIEGAGGWRVPLNRRETLADVAVAVSSGRAAAVDGSVRLSMTTAIAIASTAAAPVSRAACSGRGDRNSW